jgi:S-phase kinase-associated protein 1
MAKAEQEESSEPPEPMVHLISSEGESFDVALRVARTSELVRSMVDDYSSDEAQEIPLPNVKSTILALVVEFIRRNATEPMNEIEKVR